MSRGNSRSKGTKKKTAEAEKGRKDEEKNKGDGRGAARWASRYKDRRDGRICVRARAMERADRPEIRDRGGVLMGAAKKR